MTIAIIGGGASGILAALNIPKNHNVILIEQNDKIGKKLLVTGNGKCNFWNKEINTTKYNTDNISVLDSVLSHQDSVFKYLIDDLGIYSYHKNNYYYPNSNLASSIRETFELALNRPNIEILYNRSLKNIQIEKQKIKLELTNSEELIVDKVILACGGLASPKTGSNGSIYPILNDLNISYNPLRPALVPLILEESHLSKCSGLRSIVRLTLKDKEELICQEEGEIQLTDYGISGIVTLNISSKVSRLLAEKITPSLYIDFAPQDANLDKIFKTTFSQNHTIEEILETVLNYKLIPIILNKANIRKAHLGSKLTDEDIKKLVFSIKNFSVFIKDTCDYEKSQVSTGGVSLNDINQDFSLKKYPNIYVIGETLDVDGICGGYNLAFAFISGYLCGRSISHD